MIYNHISELIGNTPILKLDPKKTGLKNIDLYAKLEYMNPFGSLKDRIAKNMYDEIKDDVIKNNKTVLEASSWNTWKALALLTSCDEVDFQIVSNRMKISEYRMIMQLSGASIEELPWISDCPDLNDPNSYTTAAMNMEKNNPEKYHYTDQYFNKKNYEAHEVSWDEINDSLGAVDFFFSTLGTTGSSFWVGKKLKEYNEDLKIYWIVADAWQHIPGARNSNELWEVGFYNKDFYTKILPESTDSSITGSQDLIKNFWVMCGPTAWAAYSWAIKELMEIDKTLEWKPKMKAVFIACDRVEPYLNFYRVHKPELFQHKVSSKPKVSDINEIDISLNLNSESLKWKLSDYFIVDIRWNFPYSVWHLDWSINIVDENFAMMIEEWKVFPKSKKILVVCRVWTISNKYAQFLSHQGYEAYSLDWWFTRWKKEIN